MEIEDRIFELLGKDEDAPVIVDTVAAEYGLERAQVKEVCHRVINERGTPRLARVREAIDGLGRISFV
jgi:hypothetical protein